MPVLLKSWYHWPNSKIPKRVCFCCLDFVLFYLFIFSKARVIILRSKRVVLYACPWIPITAMRRVWLPNSHPLTKGRRSVENEGWPELSSSFSFTPVVADGPSPPLPLLLPLLALYSVGKQTFLTFCKGWKTKNLWLLIRLRWVPHLNEKSESGWGLRGGRWRGGWQMQPST